MNKAPAHQQPLALRTNRREKALASYGASKTSSTGPVSFAVVGSVVAGAVLIGFTQAVGMGR